MWDERICMRNSDAHYTSRHGQLRRYVDTEVIYKLIITGYQLNSLSDKECSLYSLHTTGSKPIVLLYGLDLVEELCDGKPALVKPGTRIEYDCRTGRDRCPAGSYCHKVADGAKCCREGGQYNSFFFFN